MRIKKKDLRKRLAQLPINYPAPTIDQAPLDYETEKDRVENLCRRLAHNEVEVRDEVLAELPRYLKDITRVFADREHSSTVAATSSKKPSKKGRDSAGAAAIASPPAAAASMADAETKQLELVLLKLCLGIFYCFWHSDKPLVQHACAQRIAELLHAPQTDRTKAIFLRCFIHVLCREWCKIDRYRLDKYMALVRKVIHETLMWLLKGYATEVAAAAVSSSSPSSSPSSAVSAFCINPAGYYQHVVGTFQALVDAQTSVGLLMHVCDVCLDEFTRAELPLPLFTTLARDVPLFAMSKGNYVEKRVLDFFIAPLAGGKLHPEELEDDEATEEVAAADDHPTGKGGLAISSVRQLAAKRRRLLRQQQVEERAKKLQWELDVIGAMALLCRDMSVATSTVRRVRTMFAEAQLLLHGRLTTLQPQELQPARVRLTRQSRQLALGKEVQEADDNRIAVVLARRDRKILRTQERDDDEQPQRKKVRRDAAAASDAAATPTSKKLKRKEAKAAQIAAPAAEAKPEKKKSATALATEKKKLEKAALQGKVKRITKRRKEYIMSRADYEDSADDQEEEEF